MFNSRTCGIAIASLLFAIDAKATCYADIKHRLPVSGTVIFGEVHGTNEIPDFFLRCAKEFTDQKEQLAVYLEIPESDGKLVQGYIDHSIDAGRLLESPHWRKTDGRASAAMFQLVKGLRALPARSLSVYGFDLDGGGVDRDLGMMHAFLNTYSPSRYNLILTGNLHARTSIGSPWNPVFKPFAHHLRNRIANVVSLDVQYRTGSAWICTPGCGSNPLVGSSAPFSPGPKVNFGARSEAFDGNYVIEKLSASPPVSEDHLKRN